jgi:hypothetical protein
MFDQYGGADDHQDGGSGGPGHPGETASPCRDQPLPCFESLRLSQEDDFTTLVAPSQVIHDLLALASAKGVFGKGRHQVGIRMRRGWGWCAGHLVADEFWQTGHGYS